MPHRSSINFFYELKTGKTNKYIFQGKKNYMKIIQIVGNNISDITSFTTGLLDEIQDLFPGKTGIITETKGESLKKANFHEELKKNREFSLLAEYWDDDFSIETAGCDLPGILDMFADSGMKYVILSGFKDCSFKKVVIGDEEPDNCILKNPSAGEVIENLDRFDEHLTMQGLIKELKEEIEIPLAGCILSFNGLVREITGDERTEYMEFSDSEKIDMIISGIRADIEKVPGVLGVRFHHNKGRLYAGDDVTYIAVAASHRQEAFRAMMDAIDRLKADLHDKK